MPSRLRPNPARILQRVCAWTFLYSAQRKLDEEIRARVGTLRLYPDAAAVSFHHLFGDEEVIARGIFYECGTMSRYE